MLGPYLIPVGQPILLVVPVAPMQGGGETCMPYTLGAGLAGQTFYMSYASSNGTSIEFSPQFTLAIN